MPLYTARMKKTFSARKKLLRKKYEQRWPHGLQEGCKVRCNNRSTGRACDARKTLRMPLDHYIRVPKCSVCGARNWRTDRYRQVIETGMSAPKPCDCGMYEFPHHKGRGICVHTKGLNEDMVDESRASRLSRRR